MLSTFSIKKCLDPAKAGLIQDAPRNGIGDTCDPPPHRCGRPFPAPRMALHVTAAWGGRRSNRRLPERKLFVPLRFAGATRRNPALQECLWRSCSSGRPSEGPFARGRRGGVQQVNATRFPLGVNLRHNRKDTAHKSHPQSATESGETLDFVAEERSPPELLRPHEGGRGDTRFRPIRRQAGFRRAFPYAGAGAFLQKNAADLAPAGPSSCSSRRSKSLGHFI